MRQLTALLLPCLLLTLPAAAEEGTRDADHERLRALRSEVITALNDQDLEALRACLASSFTITFADQQHFTDIDALAAYRDRLGQENDIVAITFEPTVDELTRFIAPKVGISTGTSTDTFTGASGDTTTIISRWTATVVEENGEWRVASVHAGVNLLDNPILHRVRDLAFNLGLLGAVLGLALGLGIGIWFRRRRPAKTAAQ